MGKGTGSFGKRRNKTHTLCVRCGRRSFHLQKSRCSACAFPAARLRKYNWSVKAIRRKTTGTGRMRYLRNVPRRFKTNFREGTQAAPRKPRSFASSTTFFHTDSLLLNVAPLPIIHKHCLALVNPTFILCRFDKNPTEPFLLHLTVEIIMTDLEVIPFSNLPTNSATTATSAKIPTSSNLDDLVQKLTILSFSIDSRATTMDLAASGERRLVGRCVDRVLIKITILGIKESSLFSTNSRSDIGLGTYSPFHQFRIQEKRLKSTPRSSSRAVPDAVHIIIFAFPKQNSLIVMSSLTDKSKDRCSNFRTAFTFSLDDEVHKSLILKFSIESKASIRDLQETVSMTLMCYSNQLMVRNTYREVQHAYQETHPECPHDHQPSSSSHSQTKSHLPIHRFHAQGCHRAASLAEKQPEEPPCL
ncbi:hypothetical protein V2J09_023463 [Rumex salicifolius]